MTPMGYYKKIDVLLSSMEITTGCGGWYLAACWG